MPDLYDYLKICYGAIESCGDVEINYILDSAANNCNNSAIIQIGETKCNNYIKNYIADSYYYDYLPGYMPVAYCISDRNPPQKEFIIMPRIAYWWRNM